MSIAYVLALPHFNKLFKVDCDAFGKGIGTILSQEGDQLVYEWEAKPSMA